MMRLRGISIALFDSTSITQWYGKIKMGSDRDVSYFNCGR